MFIITIRSALLLDGNFSLDFSLPQLSFCWLSEIARKRGERPLSLMESASVGEGAGGYNLDSSPHKSKKQQKILYREWSSTLSGNQSKDVCRRILTQFRCLYLLRKACFWGSSQESFSHNYSLWQYRTPGNLSCLHLSRNGRFAIRDASWLRTVTVALKMCI